MWTYGSGNVNPRIHFKAEVRNLSVKQFVLHTRVSKLSFSFTKLSRVQQTGGHYFCLSDIVKWFVEREEERKKRSYGIWRWWVSGPILSPLLWERGLMMSPDLNGWCLRSALHWCIMGKVLWTAEVHSNLFALPFECDYFPQFKMVPRVRAIGAIIKWAIYSAEQQMKGN